MSSRALRKLHGTGTDPLDQLPVQVESSDSDNTETEYDATDTLNYSNKSVNPFDLLDNDSVNEEDEPESFVQSSTQPVCSTGKSRKKKKKKKSKEKNREEIGNTNADDVEASVREVNALLGEIPHNHGDHVIFDSDSHVTMAMKALLSVEHKNLNADNEMRRIFGSRVVQNEVNRRRNTSRRHVQRSTWLVRAKDSWPPHSKSGLSMQLLESQRGLNYFALIHSKQYEEIQFKFLDAVESLQPQNIMNVLQLHPYHIDSLLQLSEVCKMSEDIQMATELVERALYAFECSFHSLFSLTQGNCRLDYRRPENRALYLALFRHLVFVGQRGCCRTALEFCKLILSFDPDGDPLCMLLMIDFYALRSEQYDFLIRMYHEWEAHKNLSQLPNLAFSLPLAMFHHAQAEHRSTDAASQLLQRSLLMFPGVLIPLLEQCSVQPDKEVTNHTYFASHAQTSQTEALRQLIALYIGRSFSCWKVPEVVTWLEHNVKDVMRRVDDNDPLVKQFADKRRSRYQGTPRNIFRHIIISEIKEATAALPPEIAHSPILSYDPLPPVDSINTYSRPERLRRAQEESGALSLFFRSLLPNFNAQEIVEEGAAGGADGHNLQQGVGALMNAMRDLLNNIRPVEPPLENQHDEQHDEDQVDEWD